MDGPGLALYRRVVPGRLRVRAYLVRFFWKQSAGLSALASPGPRRLWLASLRVLLCFKLALSLRSIHRAVLPVWIDDTDRALVSHWCDLLVLGEIYRPPRDYELPGLPRVARTIVDLGANVGFSARFLGERYPDARVIAFEPDPESFELAQRNLAGRAHVSLRNVGVAGEPGSLELHRFAAGSWSTSTFMSRHEVMETFAAEAVTLDSIIEEVGDIDLLKIDIEGAEYEVLEACRQLDRVRCIVGEVHTIPGGRPERLFALLGGFQVSSERVQRGRGPFIATRPAVDEPSSTAP